MKHEKFNFKHLADLQGKIEKLGIDIKLDSDFSPLGRPVKVGNRFAPNAIAALPMEGCDSEVDGSPSGLVERRYLRYASGGYGLVWWEACAVVEEGRANELQMMLTDQNLDQFATLLSRSKKSANQSFGDRHNPLNILQLTHSGRYSRPKGHKQAPLIPQYDPILDPLVGVDADYPLLTDTYLDELIGRYQEAAVRAEKAGFDGVDLKSCHRYLLNELLASYGRKGNYGGSFENRTRFHREAIAAIRAATGPDFIIACRFNVFDAHPYPYGFGVDKDDFWVFDPEEPLAFVKMLCEEGVTLLSNTAGNPYYIYPQVTRPFDQSSQGIPVPDEHPLKSVARLFDFTRMVQKAAGKIPVVGNGYSWLRQFIPYAGAANLADGSCQLMGLGRSSFAYPDAPKDILEKGALDPSQCCTTCSKCTQIMRDHGRTGCVVRDAKVYLPLYREYRQEAEAREVKLLS